MLTLRFIIKDAESSLDEREQENSFFYLRRNLSLSLDENLEFCENKLEEEI